MIYGLSNVAYAVTDQTTGERSFSAGTLPLDEQFRYVAYDASLGRLDWTHEREWRWPLNVPPWHDPDGIPPGESNEIPGLDMDDPALHGIGVIVRTPQEADRIVHDVLTKVDRGDVAEDHYQFILASETIPDWSVLRDPLELETEIYTNLVDLAPYFAGRRRDAQAMADELDRVAAEVEASTSGSSQNYYSEHGGCWLWLRNNRHPIVRALALLGRLNVNGEGRYLVDLPSIDQSRPLRQRQEMFAEVAARLERDYELPGTYYAVLGSWDMDGIPSYHDDDLEDDFFYNFNWTPEP